MKSEIKVENNAVAVDYQSDSLCLHTAKYRGALLK